MSLLKSIKAIILLDIDGKYILGRSYDDEIISDNLKRNLFTKTKGQKIKDEIVALNDMLIIHKFVTDFHLYVIGKKNENPMILDSVSSCILDVIKMLAPKNVESSVLDQNKAQLIIAIDEICDDGTILETDPDIVHQRVCLRDESMEPSMARKLQSATDYIKFSWIRS